MANTLTITVRPAGTVTKALAVNVAPSGSVVGVRRSLSVNVGIAGGSAPKVKSLTVNVGILGPRVSLGPNRAIEAGDLIVLTPSVTPVPGTTITALSWAQDGVPLSTTTSPLQVKAPITRFGANLSFSLVATDSNGNSSPSTVNVLVYPAPLRGAGGVPMVERAA